eukprot:921261-Pleurochrysis_carterae.AAC.1
MAVASEAQIPPLPIRLRRIHGYKERGHMARIAQRGRQGRGGGQQRRAAVVQEPRLPASELPGHVEGRKVHERRRVRVPAQ